ncbi:hypothetical protein GCM10011490_14820 [Pseudoclavibacter endophyticus]|uniref:Metallopeptidase family protein n=1 Tax=Pseudoclavibacter endophyticus TaxID=1778590 RepID=A0A6H9WM94_9MICO|nr:hypothetical protein [Pseudoclavibacter endophyticus]KAB1649128.1 hypothetical protein F8O04_02265 [Pseudoclavibacter endophyticus]GGA65173.1 hypothetical protein GCM10011490_14820 [Pseudoclavibacter endophyticus]
MARRRDSRRITQPRPARGLARGRHGRGVRSSVAGPYLPMLTGRIPRFEQTVAETMDFLRAQAPEKLEGIRLEVAGMPPDEQQPDAGIERWRVVRPSTIVLFRVPIDRLAKLHCPDPVHYRMHIERVMLEAIGDLLGKDPWDILPDRYDAE